MGLPRTFAERIGGPRIALSHDARLLPGMFNVGAMTATIGSPRAAVQSIARIAARSCGLGGREANAETSQWHACRRADNTTRVPDAAAPAEPDGADVCHPDAP